MCASVANSAASWVTWNFMGVIFVRIPSIMVRDGAPLCALAELFVQLLRRLHHGLLCSCSSRSPLAAQVICPLNAAASAGDTSARHSLMCMMYVSTSGASFLKPPYYSSPLPGSAFESLRVIGSLVTPVLSAVSKALVMSTRLRWVIARWISLLAPLRGLLSLLCSPLLWVQ
jgi:hypothetical protein